MGKRGLVWNWSRYPVVDANVHVFRTVSELRGIVGRIPRLITRGSGLSYGDASLAPEILSTRCFNKVLEFDALQGVIQCESGVTLDEVLKITVPHGWFLPVTPGTKFVTLGGAVAADVHGKNHHREGSLSRHVYGLAVMRSDGVIDWCDREENRELFHHTCGGMGLTGVILEVGIRLKRIQTSYIVQRNLRAESVDHLIDLLQAHASSTYSVAWLDCLAAGRRMGRSILMLGEHAGLQELPGKMQRNPLPLHKDPWLTTPFTMPAFTLNRFSVRTFNSAYNLKQRLSRDTSLVHYDPYFYPLDFVRFWNRLYGKRGLLQYQFVVPLATASETMRAVLERLNRRGLFSFLTVAKMLGNGANSLSFPMPGLTLSLDFPISRKLYPFLDELDELITQNGGRIYLAKDARASAAIISRCYPGLPAFKQFLGRTESGSKFESLLSKRLSLTP